MAGDWRTASRDSAGIAPDPRTTPEAVVQVYAARAWGWRGRFAVHTWIAVKPAGAPVYTVYEVIGWRATMASRHSPFTTGPPTAAGSGPSRNFCSTFAVKASMMSSIGSTVPPDPTPTRMPTMLWPGPNSNTFTAHVSRTVPELIVDLPPTAIGKDYLSGSFVAQTPSGSGFQISLFGLVGMMVALDEGLEVNVLGLVFGIDPNDLAVKLPMIGKLGFSSR